MLPIARCEFRCFEQAKNADIQRLLHMGERKSQPTQRLNLLQTRDIGGFIQAIAVGFALIWAQQADFVVVMQRADGIPVSRANSPTRFGAIRPIFPRPNTRPLHSPKPSRASATRTTRCLTRFGTKRPGTTTSHRRHQCVEPPQRRYSPSRGRVETLNVSVSVSGIFRSRCLYREWDFRSGIKSLAPF